MELRDEMLVDLNKSLKKLCEDTGEIKGQVTGIKDHLISINGRCATHDKRIRSMEKKIWTLSGMASVIGAGATWLIQHILKKP